MIARYIVFAGMLVATAALSGSPGATPRDSADAQWMRGNVGVKAMGKRFVVYSAMDFVKDGCDDHSMQRGLRWYMNSAASGIRWRRFCF